MGYSCTEISQTWWYFWSADSKLICSKIVSMQWLEGEDVFKLVDSQCEMGKTSSWHDAIFIQGSVKPFQSVWGGRHIAPLVEINTINEYKDNSSLYSLIQLTLELLIDICKIIVWFPLPLTLHCIFFRYFMSRSLFQPGKLSYGKIINWIMHLRKQSTLYFNSWR